jgi:adenylate cyclase
LVLQYVGDGIEAAFGAPVPCEDHAEQCLLAALDMRKALEEFNCERETLGKAPFKQGIGVHTGMVLAGNTGSEDHLSYALIGETVNVAARVQDLTKKFSCDILITEETAGSLTGMYRLVKESPVMVKGYSRPVTVYRVLG